MSAAPARVRARRYGSCRECCGVTAYTSRYCRPCLSRRLSAANLVRYAPQLGLQDPWADHAACGGDPDPEAWFRGDGRSRRYALTVCGRCPVRVDCLRAALRDNRDDGIWGGMLEDDRRALRKGPGR